MRVKKVKAIYFYPLIIGKIDKSTEKKLKNINFMINKSDKYDRNITSPFIYFRHTFAEKSEKPFKNIEFPIKASISGLPRRIKWRKNKNGISEFEISLMDLTIKFIGLNNSQAVFWVEVDVEPKTDEYEKLFAHLVGLTHLGDYEGPYIKVDDTERKIPILVAQKGVEYCQFFKGNDLINRANDCVEQKDANPYILLILCLSDDDSVEKDEDFIEKFVKKNNLNIVSLLVRSEMISFTDKNFISKYCIAKAGRLINMCARKDLFINVHERVAIAICTKETEEFIAELIKSIAYLRALWYSFAVTDFWIAKEITDYYKRIKNIEKELENKSDIQITDKAIKDIQELTGIKSLAISFLDEVITYKIQRGSLKGIIDALWDYFNMSHIKENIKFKLSQVDSILDYLIEIQGRIISKSIDLQMKKLT